MKIKEDIKYFNINCPEKSEHVVKIIMRKQLHMNSTHFDFMPGRIIHFMTSTKKRKT